MFIDMRGAEWKEKDRYEQQPDARRFEDWEFAYSTVLGTKEAIQHHRNVGEDKVWKQIKLLAGLTRQKLEAINGVKVMDRGPEQGGLVTFHAARSNPGYIVQELLVRKINCVQSIRPYGLIDFDEKQVGWVVRVSPTYYNTVEEIDTFIDALKEILNS